jgi:hypothetical protein
MSAESQMRDEMLVLAQFLMRGSTYTCRNGIEYVSDIYLSVHDRDLIVEALKECARNAFELPNGPSAKPKGT